MRRHIHLLIFSLVAIGLITACRASSPASSSERFLATARLLTKTPHHGEGGNVEAEMVFNTKEFFKAKAAAEAPPGKADEVFASYEQQFGLEDNLVFTLSLNTHSGDLAQYPLEKLAILRDDQGRQLPARRWEEDAISSSHHRSGRLIFPKATAEGSPIVDLDTKYLEVVIQGISGVEERVFRWELPIAYPD